MEKFKSFKIKVQGVVRILRLQKLSVHGIRKMTNAKELITFLEGRKIRTDLKLFFPWAIKLASTV